MASYPWHPSETVSCPVGTHEMRTHERTDLGLPHVPFLTDTDHYDPSMPKRQPFLNSCLKLCPFALKVFFSLPHCLP